MARSFAGGTDGIRYGEDGWNAVSVGTMSFWLKTTQATANAVPLALWNSSSRVGFGFLLNDTANKLTVQCYGISGTPVVQLISAASVNDGNWHHIALVYDRSNGAASNLYVDGAFDKTGNASAAWGGTATPLCLGDNIDAFWPSYVGHLAEVGFWFRQLTAEEIAALAKGYSPKLFGRPDFYAPLVRGVNNIRDAFVHSTIGTTVSDHPRVIGGAV